jgi:hypothetical protein
VATRSANCFTSLCAFIARILRAAPGTYTDGVAAYRAKQDAPSSTVVFDKSKAERFFAQRFGGESCLWRLSTAPIAHAHTAKRTHAILSPL